MTEFSLWGYDPSSPPPEPPVGTWVKDKYGGTSKRQERGWGAPGMMPFGVWEAMWAARGPLVECTPWGIEPEKTEHVWHSTGPAASDGHHVCRCPGEGQCPVVDLGYDRSPGEPKTVERRPHGFDAALLAAFEAGVAAREMAPPGTRTDSPWRWTKFRQWRRQAWM